jgi:hypothetical protein
VLVLQLNTHLTNRRDVLDNLLFERIWQDKDFFELRITASSRVAKATVDCYAIDEDILDLSKGLSVFPKTVDDELFWSLSEKGEKYTPYFSMRVFCKDKYGHIRIEVYLEICDGGPLESHNTCFYIDTEAGLLNKFGEKVKCLIKPEVGTKVSIYDENYI